MTVSTFNQPDYTVDTATEYKTNIDAAVAVVSNVADDFAPHEAAAPNMTIKVAPGKIYAAGVLVEQSEQTSATITAPTTNPRIDRIVIDGSTGAVSVITGAEAASPTAPALTPGVIAVATVLLATSTTQITNSLITDDRALFFSTKNYAVLDAAQTFTGASNFTGALQKNGVEIKEPVDVVVSTVTRFVETQIQGDLLTGGLSSSTYSQALASTGSGTIGPSGSGASTTWSMLDNIPSDTKYLLLHIIANTGNIQGGAPYSPTVGSYRAELQIYNSLITNCPSYYAKSYTDISAADDIDDAGYDSKIILLPVSSTFVFNYAATVTAGSYAVASVTLAGYRR
ncbi:MAG: DUF4815 domain-containing protein [Rhodospirillaceae bacterium]|nr:DUF4815 domain-containing protein [Rhodospirillaceae bacterium]